MINIDDRILSEVDENQLFLLCAIAKHMGSNAKAWPSNKTLCETTKWSPNKLQRVKQSAIEAGLLGSESRFQKNAQTSNVYKIKTRRIGVMVNLADIEPHPQNGVPPHPQNGGTEVLTNEVLTNEQHKAGKPPKAEKKEVPIIHKMVEVFEAEHQKHFKDSAGVWIGFTWQVKEFGALKSLSKEFEKRLRGRGVDFSEPAILNGWQTFLKMAAEADKFTLQNHYTPTKLWSNFQGIIQKIQQKNGSHNQSKSGAGQSRADKNKGAFERLVQSVAADGIR